MANQIELKWTKAYTFEELLCDGNLSSGLKSAGVYLWTEPPGRINRVFYVGKTEGIPSLWFRQIQYYQSFAGGQYAIPGFYRACGKDWQPRKTRVRY